MHKPKIKDDMLNDRERGIFTNELLIELNKKLDMIIEKMFPCSFLSPEPIAVEPEPETETIEITAQEPEPEMVVAEIPSKKSRKKRDRK